MIPPVNISLEIVIVLPLSFPLKYVPLSLEMFVTPPVVLLVLNIALNVAPLAKPSLVEWLYSKQVK